MPGTDSQGREGTASPGSTEWWQQTLLCPQGPASVQCQCCRAPACSWAPLACTLALLMISGLDAHVFVKSLPATHGCLPSAASPLLACSTLWFWSGICALFVNLNGLSVPGDVLWAAPAYGGAWPWSWVEHQSQGCPCHSLSLMPATACRVSHGDGERRRGRAWC